MNSVSRRPRRTRLVRAAFAGLVAATALTGAPMVAAQGIAHATPTTVAAPIRLDGASNFRDIGGYQTADGRTVRSGIVFRSNKLSSLTDSDKQQITAAGITLDVDLRNASERKEAPDQLPASVRYQVADVVGIDHGIWFHEFVPLTLGRALIDAYTTGSSNVGQSIGYPFMVTFRGSDFAFHDLVTAVANNSGGTVFHCSAGKDRTGWGTAILLSILGVPRATIEADFLKSNTYLGRSDAVELSWLNAAYDEVERLYGSMDAYVRKGLKISGPTIDALRSRLLV
ncbi:tyrosine-protein phosphatase [Gordonia neofelifaecis]|uniref:Protein-tyrosine-phosphatase n=1 Tax=Gordonia neofelifaecis NRRL B-59395 TaxID=644548 RepID=F1YFM2_9ACTN|nr:tyrosine-protein phosphatase [Gordonia neofelifaecis]EGD56406.1 protein-tyrosine-phosphatase [Gordonia neofelifaecis NRRL B-59395]